MNLVHVHLAIAASVECQKRCADARHELHELLLFVRARHLPANVLFLQASEGCQAVVWLLGRASFTGLVLGCIEATFCKKICV